MFNILKRILFKAGSKLCRIKLGIARGYLMRINRRLNMREEFGIYEMGIAGIFRRFSKSARVAYDIGSCVGYYTLAMARQKIEKIYAFECNDKFLSALRHAIDSNNIGKQVYVVEKRLGSGNNGRNDSLDNLFSRGEIVPADFIKIDVDGGEYDILLGAKELINAAHPDFIIEVHSSQLEKDCISYLEGFGYRVRKVDNPFWQKILFPERRSGYNRWIVAAK